MRLARTNSAAPRDLGPREAIARHFVLASRTSALPGAIESEPHRHREAQIMCILRGEITCEASRAWWIVPPGSALWVPGGVEHRIRAEAPLEGYNVFVAPEAASHLPTECCAVAVTPLFHEVVRRVAARLQLAATDGPAERLVAVLLDELSTVAIDGHRLPMPTDPRLRKLVTLMTSNPADGADLKTWARRIGVAERTLTRILVQETGLSFRRWRQQLHIVLAIQSLSRGASVQSVAGSLGYESASSFVLMFRKALGTSPAKYMAERSVAR